MHQNRVSRETITKKHKKADIVTKLRFIITIATQFINIAGS